MSDGNAIDLQNKRSIVSMCITQRVVATKDTNETDAFYGSLENGTLFDWATSTIETVQYYILTLEEK